MSKVAMLDFATFLQAVRNWDDAHNVVPVWPNKWPSFSNNIKEFLNWDPKEAKWVFDSPNIKGDKVWVPEHTLHKFNLLASPYAAAWVRIYYIRKKDHT
jgi:hypothetical protein